MNEKLLKLQAQALIQGYRLVPLPKPKPAVPEQWALMTPLPSDSDFDDVVITLCPIANRTISIRTANALARAYYTRRRLYAATPAEVFAVRCIGYQSLDEIDAWRQAFIAHLSHP